MKRFTLSLYLILSLLLVGCSSSQIVSESGEASDSVNATDESNYVTREELDLAYESIIEARECGEDLCGTICAYWNYNGFECFFDYTEYDSMMRRYATNKNGDNPRGSFYGDAKSTFENRDAIDKLMSIAKDILKKDVKDEDKDYYDAIKGLYLKIDAYTGFASNFPEGYSKITYLQTYSNYKSEIESLISNVEFAK